MYGYNGKRPRFGYFPLFWEFYFCAKLLVYACVVTYIPDSPPQMASKTSVSLSVPPKINIKTSSKCMSGSFVYEMYAGAKDA